MVSHKKDSASSHVGCGMRRLLLLCLLGQALRAWCEADFYEVLGLSDSATDAEIKRAYRDLSLKHHPDKGGSTAMFKQVTQAYEVLRDSEKRMLYDVGGTAAVEKGVGGTDMFGRSVGVQKGQTVSVTVDVPLDEMYSGGDVRARVRRRVVCRGCKNGGPRNWAGYAPDKCAQCTPSCPQELKTVHRRMGHMMVQQQVHVASEERCKEEERTLHALIERGMNSGESITFKSAGEQSPGEIPGDVQIVLRAKSHAVFKRDEEHLSMKLQISLREALLGFERRIRHLDGHQVLIANDAISSPGQVIVIRGEGMPIKGVPSEFGELRVELQVNFPKSVSAEEREWLQNHFHS